MKMADIARQQFWGIPGTSPRSWFSRVVDLIVAWHRRARDRQALRRLDDHYLRDIGLTRHEIMQECEKPFWRP